MAKDKNLVLVNFRVEPEKKEDLKKIAKANRRSLSNELRVAAENHIKANRKSKAE